MLHSKRIVGILRAHPRTAPEARLERRSPTRPDRGTFQTCRVGDRRSGGESGYSRPPPRWLAVILPLLCCFIGPVHAATPWQDAIRAMPLSATTPLLNRDNAAGILLQSFRSNDVVKGLLILPDVFDDFYLIHRDQPALNIRATNVLDALVQFTNRTALRLTFREPFLMVHIASDRLEPSVRVEDSATVQRLKAKRVGAHLVFVDTHWERLQPRLSAELDCTILPGAASQEAWHFARHNFAACNLTGWQLIEATTLTGKTTGTVQKQAIVFREFSGN